MWDSVSRPIPTKQKSPQECSEGSHHFLGCLVPGVFLRGESLSSLYYAHHLTGFVVVDVGEGVVDVVVVEVLVLYR